MRRIPSDSRSLSKTATDLRTAGDSMTSAEAPGNSSLRLKHCRRTQVVRLAIAPARPNSRPKIMKKIWLLVAGATLAGLLACKSEVNINIQTKGQAPDFELENIAGGTTKAAELKGKVSVVDVW